MTMLAQVGEFIGGIGLFLLGMWLMTDGLRVAAGNALRQVLASGTRTPARGLLAGIGLTAAVQSSSAVTVAAIGFVNAGLLTLTQAVWVIFGSNIGTTMTGWIVAVTGIQVRLDVYALPLIGIGMLIRSSGAGSKRAAWGQALVGFAIFLLAIQSLKTNFSVLADQVDFSTLPSSGWIAWLIYFGLGMVMTFLVQSSSATTAITISAASAGVIPVPLAALVIIGADLGTSSTAAVASVGATANARRAAASHVLLNLATAGFAVLTLSLLLQGVVVMRELLRLPDDPGITLALFSTTFNILGVALMVPFATRMVRFLERRFVSQEEDLARPRYLDAAMLEAPALALRGVMRELQRLGQLSLSLIVEASTRDDSETRALNLSGTTVDALGERIREYVGRMNRRDLPPEVADTLAPLLRVLQHYEEGADFALAHPPPEDPGFPGYPALREKFAESVRMTLAVADTTSATFDTASLQQAEDNAEQQYESLKAQLLAAAAVGRLTVPAMDRHMQDIASLRRAMERVAKAARRLEPFRKLVDEPRITT